MSAATQDDSATMPTNNSDTTSNTFKAPPLTDMFSPLCDPMPQWQLGHRTYDIVCVGEKR